MADSTNKQEILKDFKVLAQRLKATTDSLSDRVSKLENLALVLLEFTNSIIANIEERKD